MEEGKGRRLQNDMERDEKNVIIRRKYFYIGTLRRARL